MDNTISKAKLYGSIFALGVTGGSIYILPYIKFVFYDLQLQTTGMNNTQSALLMSVYAIVGMFVMIPCGAIVDRMNLKRGLQLALLGMGSYTKIHPLLKRIPIQWDKKVSYGLLYSNDPPEAVRKFIEAVKEIIEETK